MSVETYRRLGLDVMFDEQRLGLEVNGRRNAEIVDALATTGDRAYHPCSQATRRDGVPTGTVTRHHDWDATQIFEGTTRDVATYLPAAIDLTQPAPLIVFNDGLGYLDESGPVRAAAVLDTLIARGELPPIIAVFVMPGRPDGITAAAIQSGGRHRERAMAQRCFEYDSMTDDYVRFLDDELLPDMSRRLGCTFTDDATQRAVGGISSGGICAFNAAWHRPESFGRVISHCGSFVNIRGGHNYPYLIRSTPRKPLRVFLQSGAMDADIVTGNWPLANKQIASALDFAGYDFRFEFGTGGHSLRHGGAMFADTLRWLWRDAS